MKLFYTLILYFLTDIIHANRIKQKAIVKRSVFDIISNAGQNKDEKLHEIEKNQISIFSNNFKEMKYEDLRKLFLVNQHKKNLSDNIQRGKTKKEIKKPFLIGSRNKYESTLHEKKKENISITFSFLTKL